MANTGFQTTGGVNEESGPRLTLMDAFNKTSTFTQDPQISFGTGSRPSLVALSNTPGPGSYQIKTTLKKTVDSTIESPVAYTIRSRHNFGNPNLKAMSKTTANEPGPGSYKLESKFLSGTNSSKYSFPKQRAPMEKSQLAPGPGQYELPPSMGKQPLSTKERAQESPFSLSSRPSLIAPGTTTIGPGQYGLPPSACEQQVDSRKPTKSAIRFGTGYTKAKSGSIQKIDMKEPAPGPGSYNLPGGVSTAKRGDPYRSSPAASLSGRNKFGSPCDEVLARIEEKKQKAIRLKRKREEEEEKVKESPHQISSSSSSLQQSCASSEEQSKVETPLMVCQEPLRKVSSVRGGEGMRESSGNDEGGHEQLICGQSVDKGIYDAYGERVCSQCSQCYEKYDQLTKQDVSSQYLLTDSTIRMMKCMEKNNPRNPNWSMMKLYLRKHAIDLAVERWGSLDALNHEARRRDQQKLNKQKEAAETVFSRSGTVSEKKSKAKKQKLKMSAIIQTMKGNKE